MSDRTEPDPERRNETQPETERERDAAADHAPSLTIRRHLRANAAKVWAAWTQPEQLMRWMQPLGNTCVHAEADVRVGGRFRVVMHAPDGEVHDVSGTYLEVVPEQKLAFTWAWHSAPQRESRVTVRLQAEGEATLLTLTHERFFDEAARNSHHQGWTSALDLLAARLDRPA